MLKRGQFTFYGSFYKAIRRIRSKSARADAYDAICAYALEEIQPELENMPDAAAIAFDLIKPNLDAGMRKASGAYKASTARGEKRDSTDTAQMRHSKATDTPQIPHRYPTDTPQIGHARKRMR